MSTRFQYADHLRACCSAAANFCYVIFRWQCKGREKVYARGTISRGIPFCSIQENLNLWFFVFINVG